MSKKDMVTFLMPDGTEVSNDPRFDIEDAREEALAATENTGDAGVSQDEFDAQTQRLHAATLNSGQPGVGDNAAPEDPVRDAYGPLGSPAQQVQKEDVQTAKEAGADPNSTSVDDAEPVDSNEAVLEARKAKEERREAAQKAQEKLGDGGPGDPEEPYTSWSAPQLKAEALRRNAERDGEDQIDLGSVKKKSQLAQLLQDDDDAHANG